jgi:hypothetical protein
MAARFWVGGTGNWDAATTTNWAASSGGAGGQSVPGSSDDVTFDASSGAGTVTITASQTVLSITGGAHTGTVDFNGQTISAGSINWSGSGTRSLTLGAAAITLTTGTLKVWNFDTTTNLTFSGASSTITCNATTQTFSGGGKTFGTIIATGAGTFTVGTSTTCTTFTRTGTATKTDGLQIGTGINLTVSGTFTANGNSAINRLLISAQTVGTARTITAATADNTTINNCDFQDITGAGAATWNMASSSVGNCGGNSMKALGTAAFTTAAAQTVTMSANKNASDITIYTSRVPLPQDDVSLASVTGGTLTMDMPRWGKSIDWTSATGSPTWSFGSTTNTIYGSITTIAGMTISGTNATTLAGRGSFTLTSNTNSYTQAITITAPTGTYTLSDKLITAGALTLNNGDLEGNGKDCTFLSFASSNSNTRTLTLGSGTWSSTSTSTATIWNIATTSGLTFTGTSSVIAITGTSSNVRTFAGGGLTYGTLTYNLAGSTGELDITGSNTFAAFNFSDVTNTRTLKFTAGTTTTISAATGWNVNGTSGKKMVIDSITAATHTISVATATVSSDYLDLAHSIATGGASFFAGANSTDEGTNTGWIFTAPVTGGGNNAGPLLMGVG